MSDNTVFDNIRKSIKKNILQVYGDTNSKTYNVSYNISSVPINHKDVNCNSISNNVKSIETGFMPPMVRWLSQSKDIIVFEKPPEIKKISITPEPKYAIENMSFKEIEEKSFNIEIFIPWQVYLILLNNNQTPAVMAAFLRDKKLQNLLDPVYTFPLPNVYTDGRICTPVLSSVAQMESKNVSQLVQNAYQIFWSSSFNYDLVASCLRAAKNNFIATDNCQHHHHTTIMATNFLHAWDKKVLSMEDINFVPVAEDDISQSVDEETQEIDYSLITVINRLYNNYIGSSYNSSSIVNNLYNMFAVC